MSRISTDYLIIGAGAAGMAFADSLLDHGDATITIVDRRGKPGGHWNDAYPFVTLHQVSEYYGVNSTILGEGRKALVGPNKGYYELASGAEVVAYYDLIMQRRLLPSGRVNYYPMSDYRDGKIVSLMSGREVEVDIVKKTVDAGYFSSSIPATHTPKFEIADDVRFIPPNRLPDIAHLKTPRPDRFVIIGAGKTAMDAIIWLLRMGANADDIVWIMPRDSWVINRGTVQPGQEFFHDTIGAQLTMIEAVAQSDSIDTLFDKMEAANIMMRIDQSARPTMFHYASVSAEEVETLRLVKNVVRRGHVRRVDAEGLHFDDGIEAFGGDALYVDCTATAVERPPLVPMFQPGIVKMQMIRVPQPTFSAALAGYLEATIEDDDQKNTMSRPCYLPDTPADFAVAYRNNLLNQVAWIQNPQVWDWVINSRLDAFAGTMARVQPHEADKLAVVEKLRGNVMGALFNIPKLLGEAA
jgi:NAD(P)-binding Rossmann-like domain